MGDRHHMLVCLSELRPFLTSLPVADEGEQQPTPSMPLSLSPCLSTLSLFLSLQYISLCSYLLLSLSSLSLALSFFLSLSTLFFLPSLSLLLHLSVSSSLCLKSSQIPQQHMERERERVSGSVRLRERKREGTHCMISQELQGVECCRVAGGED